MAAPASDAYGLGSLDLVGLLTHPHLGVAVFGYLGDDTAAATALRGTCRELRDAVGAHAWHDTRTRIRRLGKWRAAFPAATAANVSREWDEPPSPLTDADFVHLRGVRELDIRRCDQETITDAAFAHLTGIHTLKMSGCSQTTITDAAFAHLAGIHTLNMSGCFQETILPHSPGAPRAPLHPPPAQCPRARRSALRESRAPRLAVAPRLARVCAASASPPIGAPTLPPLSARARASARAPPLRVRRQQARGLSPAAAPAASSAGVLAAAAPRVVRARSSRACVRVRARARASVLLADDFGTGAA